MKPICTKYVSKNHGDQLIKLANQSKLPDVLSINEIAFLFNPYSESEQDFFYKKIKEATENGELKTINQELH